MGNPKTPERIGAIGGGGILGFAISSGTVLLLDRYSQLEAFVKIASYVGMFGPEAIIILVVFGFALLVYATRIELQRLAAVATLSGSGRIDIALFQWSAIKQALKWAVGTSAILLFLAIAYAVIPLTKALPSMPFRNIGTAPLTQKLREEVARIPINLPTAPVHTVTPSVVAPVHVESGGVYSTHQTGGTVIGVNNGPPPPELIWDITESNVSVDGNYQTTYFINVVSTIPIGVLSVNADSQNKSLQRMYLRPILMGGFIGNGTGIAENGRAVETINNLTGDLQIRLTSTSPEVFTIQIGCAPVACSSRRQVH